MSEKTDRGKLRMYDRVYAPTAMVTGDQRLESGRMFSRIRP